MITIDYIITLYLNHNILSLSCSIVIRIIIIINIIILFDTLYRLQSLLLLHPVYENSRKLTLAHESIQRRANYSISSITNRLSLPFMSPVWRNRNHTANRTTATTRILNISTMKTNKKTTHLASTTTCFYFLPQSNN